MFYGIRNFFNDFPVVYDKNSEESGYHHLIACKFYHWVDLSVTKQHRIFPRIFSEKAHIHVIIREPAQQREVILLATISCYSVRIIRSNFFWNVVIFILESSQETSTTLIIEGEFKAWTTCSYDLVPRFLVLHFLYFFVQYIPVGIFVKLFPVVGVWASRIVYICLCGCYDQ